MAWQVERVKGSDFACCQKSTGVGRCLSRTVTDLTFQRILLNWVECCTQPRKRGFTNFLTTLFLWHRGIQYIRGQIRPIPVDRVALKLPSFPFSILCLGNSLLSRTRRALQYGEASDCGEAMKCSHDSCDAHPFSSHLIFMTIGRYVRLRVPELWMSSPPARCPCPPMPCCLDQRNQVKPFQGDTLSSLGAGHVWYIWIIRRTYSFHWKIPNLWNWKLTLESTEWYWGEMFTSGWSFWSSHCFCVFTC